MRFWDVDANALPKDAEFYFETTIVNIETRPGSLDGRDIWYLEGLTEARPQAIHMYEGDGTELIDYCFRGVVEITPELGVAWYRGL